VNVNIVVCQVIGPAAAVLLGAAAREQCAEESRSVDWCRPSACDVVTHHSRAHCRVPPPLLLLLLLLLLILISLSVGAPCRRPACVCGPSFSCLPVRARQPASPPAARACVFSSCYRRLSNPERTLRDVTAACACV